MADLPPLPEEAVEAAAEAGRSWHSGADDAYYRSMAAAAYPHLAAAVLRWAAEEVVTTEDARIALTWAADEVAP